MSMFATVQLFSIFFCVYVCVFYSSPELGPMFSQGFLFEGIVIFKSHLTSSQY